MPSSIPVFGPRIEVALTDAMSFEITRSAASRGETRSEWIRQACEERLRRERRAEAQKGKRATA